MIGFDLEIPTPTDLTASASLFEGSTLTLANDAAEAYPLAMKQDSALYVRLTENSEHPEEGRPAYRIEVVTIDPSLGASWLVRLGGLENAKPGAFSTELDKPGSFEFTIDVFDEKAYLLQAPDREIRVWRGNILVWWGVVARILADDKEMKVSCVTLDWYFTKRVFGRPNRTNLIPNSSFEEGTAGWGVGWWPGSYYYTRNGSAEIVQDTVIDGQRALALDQRAATTGYAPDGFWAATSALWVVDPALVEDETKGETWTAVVWIYIKKTEWEQATYDSVINPSPALRLVRFSTTSFYDLYEPDYGGYRKEPDPLGVSDVTFDGESFDKWIRLETPILQPNKAGEAETIAVFLCGIPGARVVFDRASLTREEVSIWKGYDQADIFKGIIEHAQDTTFGKSDLKIPARVTTTGIKRTRVYKHQNHEVIADVLAEFPALHQGMDWNVSFTTTERWAQTYYPRKGSRKPWATIQSGGNLVKFSVAVDGQRVANSVIVIGEGEGSDVEEGGATDPTSLDGGLVLEKVFHATPGSAVASLGEQAIRGVNRFKARVTIPEVTIPYTAEIETGDTIPVIISHGWVDINEDYRVLKITNDPSTDLMTLVINPMTEEFL